MQWLSILSLFILVQYNVAKDTAVYEVSGVEIIDLLRGFKPRENALKLTKVTGDQTNLPDGVYFRPEDEGLTGDKLHLYSNGQEKNKFR